MEYVQRGKGPPTWRLGSIVTAPGAGTALVTVAAVAGKRHYVYGVLGGKEDAAANLLQLREGAVVKVGFTFGATAVFVESLQAIHEAAVGAAVTLNSLNAGAAGIDYWAGILVATE